MLLKKLKSPRFWAAIAGAAAILLQVFGIKIPVPVINEIIATLSTVLIFFGVIEPPEKPDENATKEETDGEASNSEVNDGEIDKSGASDGETVK